MALQYRVDLARFERHQFGVSLRLESPAQDQIVSLPVWIPGSYLVREFARHLDGLKASQGGRDCVVEQIDKASWRVRCAAGEALELSWQVYAFDNSVRAAWLDAARGFFNGTSLFLRVHGQEQQPHHLQIDGLPAGWHVATAMRMAPGELSFAAHDYDEFVDHPFELGNFWSGSFEAAGLPHRVVIAGALPNFDSERLLADVQRICEAQIAFWACAPFANYCFMLNTAEQGHGGLEHRASTALLAARSDLPRHGLKDPDDGYVNLLGLFSHEYFHAWNVKRLRPAEFARYDYTQENYTELLWFFEGFTAYYDELFLRRVGLIDTPRYLRCIADTLNRVLATPGRLKQSVAQASFDAWVRLYRPDENSPNSSISYYAKGALVGLTLDLRMREAGSSLDALMLQLWQSSGGAPVDEAVIFDAVRSLAGATVADTLAQWVHGTDDLPWQTLLAQFGVQWQTQPATPAQRLGLKVSESALTGVQVKQVLNDSAAQTAGLCAGDEVLACNGWRLRRLDDALNTLAPDAVALHFLLARDQRVLDIEVTLPAKDQGASVRLLPLESDPNAAMRRKAWLGA